MVTETKAIASFDFFHTCSFFKGRVTVIISQRESSNDFRFLKVFNAGMEQIFREGLKNGWIKSNSMWIRLFNIDKTA